MNKLLLFTALPYNNAVKLVQACLIERFLRTNIS